MLEPITIRLHPQIMRELDQLVEEQAREGADKSTILRRVIALGIDAEKARRK